MASLMQHRLLLLAAVVLGGLNLLNLALAAWYWSRLRPARINVRRIVAGLVAVVAVVVVVGAGMAAVYVHRRDIAESSRVTVPGEITYGRLGSLGGKRVLPPDDPWNTPVDHDPVDTMSAKYLAAIGPEVALHPDFGPGRFGIHLYGIPYDVVDGAHTRTVRIPFAYAGESDDVPYPIPGHADVEQGGDQHLIVIDVTGWRLYELFGAHTDNNGASWQAGAGAAWSLNSDISRRDGWTSADAAGLQIFPGLARADEVYDLHSIDHALRVTLPLTQRAHVYPARHDASAQRAADLPPMGMRLRLKRSVDPASFPAGAAVIVRALQRYGLILADNGGALFVSGTADRRWKRSDLEALTRLHASDFEVVAPIPPPGSDTTASKEAERHHTASLTRAVTHIILARSARAAVPRRRR